MGIILQGSYQHFFQSHLKGAGGCGGESDKSSSLEDVYYRRFDFCEFVEPQTEELFDSIIVLQASGKTNDLGTTADGNAALKNRCWVRSQSLQAESPVRP